MKIKHLKALNLIETWFKKEDLLTFELKSSFEVIKKSLDLIKEDSEEDLDKSSFIPKEIANDQQALALYSDGGCRGNPGPGAYAYLIQDYTGIVVAEGVEFEAHTTNNRMELSGPLNGLEQLKLILPNLGREPLLTKIKVVTDSKYVVDGMKSWITGWKQRGWKKADNKTPENLDLWQKLDLAREKFLEVEWVWVKGHGGHPQNEYCDQKANEAMDANIR